MIDPAGTLPAAGVHPTAIVDPTATVPDSATIGPYSVIGPDVEIGERVRIGPHVFIERDTRVGEDCEIWKGAALGTDPQDLKYVGERTWLEIGPRTRIREFATLNRGTAATGLTSVGSDALIMAYAHVAHDCRIDDHVVLANAVNMGGHVHIGEWATVGGLTAIHQFVRIGRHAMVGGGSRLPQDVPPYFLVAGNPCVGFGINRVGLRRRGFREDTIDALKAAYRAIFRNGVPVRDALDRLQAGATVPEVDDVIAFIRASSRGVTAPGRGPARRPATAPRQDAAEGD